MKHILGNNKRNLEKKKSRLKKQGYTVYGPYKNVGGIKKYYISRMGRKKK